MANVSDIIPAILPIMLGLLGIIIFFGVYRMLKTNVNKLTRGVIGFSIVMTILLLIGSPVVGSVQAVTIEVPTFSFDGLPSTVECEGLAVSTEYSIHLDAVAETNFTTSATDTEYTVLLTFDRPTDGILTVAITLAAGTTSYLDSVDVQLPTFETFIPTEVIIGLGVLAIILAVLVGVVVDVKKGKF